MFDEQIVSHECLLAKLNLDSHSILHEVRLIVANLSKAILARTDLNKADLAFATLISADLRNANLAEANLIGAYLMGANLSGALLVYANLTDTSLLAADLLGALLGETVFANIDLSTIKNIETCLHRGPSILDHRTLMKSGRLPEVFLRGCGLPDSLINYLPSLLNEPVQFYSCFISYSSKDEEFAKRLHADLQNNSVRCWFAPEDMIRQAHQQDRRQNPSGHR